MISSDSYYFDRLMIDCFFRAAPRARGGSQARGQIVAATAPIKPLAWKPLYAMGAALGKDEKDKNKKIKK